MIGSRKLLFAMIFTLATAGVSSANNVYLAQTAQGSGTGADCSDALAVAYFNTSSNWTSSTPTGTKIGPGTTVYLCGTISANLTFQGNGASDSPVVLDGSNATMNARVVVPTQCWTVQNITTGSSWPDPPNSVISVADSGAGAYGTIQNNHIDVQMGQGAWSGAPGNHQIVWLNPGAHDITIQNNYLRASTPSGGDGIDTDIIAAGGAYNVTIQGNYLEEAMDVGDDSGACTSTGPNQCHDDFIQGWNYASSFYGWTIRYNYMKENSTKVTYQQMFMMEQFSAGATVDIYSNVINKATTADVMTIYDASTANIYNNTVILGANGSGFKLEGAATAFNLTNNIVYASNSSPTFIYDPNQTAYCTRNSWYGGSGSPLTGLGGNNSCATSSGDTYAQDPLFTNFAGGDFSLQSGSPAIKAGVSLGSSYNQYPIPKTIWPNPALGTRSATGAWDLGAFGPSGGTAPAPPTGLTATIH